MTVGTRLRVLERLVGATPPRCPACGAPGKREVVVLHEGVELNHCRECGGAIDALGGPVGIRTLGGGISLKVVTLHDGPAREASQEQCQRPEAVQLSRDHPALPK